MNRLHLLLLTLTALLALNTAPAHAAEPTTEPETFLSKSFADVSLQYVSKYIWRGFDLYPEDQAGMNPEIFISLGDTGFYTGVWAIYSLDDKNRIWDEYDFYLGYADSLFEETALQLDYDLGYTYFYFLEQHRDADTQEVAAKVTLPNLITFGEFKSGPSSTYFYGWPIHVDSPTSSWVRLAWQASYPLPTLSANNEPSDLLVYAETFHNNGAGGLDSHPGFSHVTFTAKQEVFRHEAFAITPQVNYQLTFEESVNKENEFWFHVKASYGF